MCWLAETNCNVFPIQEALLVVLHFGKTVLSRGRCADRVRIEKKNPGEVSQMKGAGNLVGKCEYS